jgi:hypothetical protein
MHRTATGLGIAAALGFAVSLGAQTPTTTSSSEQAKSGHGDPREMTVTGCVTRGSDGRFMLTSAQVEPASAATTTTGAATTTTGSSGAATTTGTSGTAGRTTEPSGSGTTASTTWALTGSSDLDKHVGHKVQVTGKAEEHSGSAPSASTTTAESTSAAAGSAAGAHPRSLDVKSIKLISTSCS